MRRVSPLLFALVLVGLLAIGLLAQRSWRAGPEGHHVQANAASQPGGEAAPARDPASDTDPAARPRSTPEPRSSQPQRPRAGTAPAPGAAAARADRAGTPGVLERSAADARGAPGGFAPAPPPAPTQPQRTAPLSGAVATGGAASALPAPGEGAAAGGPSPRAAPTSGSGGGQMSDADLADALARCDLGEGASAQALRERRDLGLTLLSTLPPDERRLVEQRLSSPGAEERCRGES